MPICPKKFSYTISLSSVYIKLVITKCSLEFPNIIANYFGAYPIFAKRIFISF